SSRRTRMRQQRSAKPRSIGVGEILFRQRSLPGAQNLMERPGHHPSRVGADEPRIKTNVPDYPASPGKSPDPGTGRGSPVHRQRIDLPMLSSVTECEPSKAKLQVQARLHDVDLLDADVVGEDHAAASARADEPALIIGVELVVVPLDEAREPVGEGIFATDAGRPPAPAVVARAENGRAADQEAVIGAQPCAAALPVKEKAAPSIAD